MPKKNVSRNRQKKPRRTRAKGVAKRAPAHSALTNTICSLADPFCPGARGSRWPDGNGARTVAVTFEGLYPIQTDTNGNAGVILSSATGVQLCRLQGIDISSGVAAGTIFSKWEGYDDWAGQASEFRIVSAGVRMYSVASMMNSQGIMRCIEVPSESANFSDVTENSSIYSYAYTELDEKPVKDSGILQGVLTPGGPTSRVFYDYETLDEDTHDWSNIMCVVTGGQASAIVAQMHYVVNVEIKFQGSHVMNRVASSTNAVNSSYLQQATSYVQKMVTGVFEGHKEELEKQVKEYATNYARQTARAAIASALPGPVGGMLALTM